MSLSRKLITACLAASATFACHADESSDPIIAAASAQKQSWDICVDGHPEVSCYTVKAIPDDADPDGDGLTNLEEMERALDPYRADTDRDGLDDDAELRRHLTSPTNVDSDRDSRGNQALWDGAEVKAAMSPVMKDSDGDGLDDYREAIELLGVDPRVADLPEISLRPLRPTFVLSGTYSEGESFALGVTQGYSETRGIVTTEEVVYTEGEATAVTVGTEVGAGGGAGGPGFNFGVSTSVSHEQSSSISTGFSTAVSEEITRYVELSREYSEYSEVSFDGGYFALPVEVSNTGDVGTQLEQIRMELFLRDPADPSSLARMEHVASLRVAEFEPITLGPDEAPRILTFEADGIELSIAQRALANMHRLHVRLGGLELRYSDDVMPAQQLTDLHQSTASIYIDYGPKPSTGENRRAAYRVAANLNPGAGRGVKLSRLLGQSLGLDYRVADRVPEPWFIQDAKARVRRATGDHIAGDMADDATLAEFWGDVDHAAALARLDDLIEERFDVALPAGITADSTVEELLNGLKARLQVPTLVGLNGMRGDSPGCRRGVWQRKWDIVRIRDGVSEALSGDFTQMFIKPQDKVFLIRRVDRDEDGVDLRTELRWNTDDVNDGYCSGEGRGVRRPGWDSDGDGLSDYEEIVEYGLASDPADDDTDNDGVRDRKEIREGTDPRNPDTDGDRITDYYDHEPTEYNDLRVSDVDVKKRGDRLEISADLPDNDELDRVVLLRQYENDDDSFEPLPPITTGELGIGQYIGDAKAVDKCWRDAEDGWGDCVKNGRVTLEHEVSRRGRVRYLLLTRQDFGTPEKPWLTEIYVVAGGALVKVD